MAEAINGSEQKTNRKIYIENPRKNSIILLLFYKRWAGEVTDSWQPKADMSGQENCWQNKILALYR